MAGFRKAKAEQAFLKIGVYGPAGSGKTFTSLLVAEGLAKLCKKRIAYVDTEHGTDFYAQEVKQRKVHPNAFDFDAMYTRSLTEALEAIKGLDTSVHGVVVLDSLTHLWEAARAAYSGKMTKADTIPLYAWAKIKKPYKDLVNHLLNAPIHFIICGRQGIAFQEDDETGELKSTGYKMKAESETPYEPHILVRLESFQQKDKSFAPVAIVEKDRTGILAGQQIAWPSFDNIAKPILPVLGDKQAHVETDDEAADKDADNLSKAEREKEKQSSHTLKTFKAKIDLCEDVKELKAVGKSITKEIKAKMTSADVSALREYYHEAESKIK